MRRKGLFHVFRGAGEVRRLVPGLKVVLRDLRPEDWRWVARWESDEEILRYLGKKRLTAPWPGGGGAAPRAPAGKILMDRRRVLAIDTIQNEFIGYIELRDINWRQRSAELRVCIGEKAYWGRGYGTDAVRLFVHQNFTQLKLDYIFLRVYRSNVRAIRCYQKCGFAVEAVLRAGTRRRRQFDDIVLMSIHRHRVAASGDAQPLIS